MNGWSNWATWNVSLWIDNVEASYLEKMEFCRTFTVDAASVEEFVRDLLPEGTSDMEGPQDLDDVNWEELAESWQSDVPEEEEEDEEPEPCEHANAILTDGEDPKWYCPDCGLIFSA